MASTQTSTTPKSKRPTKAQLAAAAKMAEAPKLETPKDDHTITDEQRQADAAANEQVKADAMSQFVQQQTGAGTPAVDQAAFQAELEALKKKFGVSVEVKVKPAKADKRVQNGITHPAAGTLCCKIWDAADEISKKTHGVAAAAAVREHPGVAGIAEATVKTQYARWRQYHGVTGRLPKITAMHQVQGEYEGIPEAKPNNDGVKKDDDASQEPPKE